MISVVAVLVAMALPAVAQSRVEAGVGYQLQRSNGPTGACGCFNLQGARGELAYQIFPEWSAVFEVGGGRAANINGQGLDLSLITYLGGLRYSHSLGHRVRPFGQFLAGRVHGFDSLFPASQGTFSSSNSFAFSAGGGLDYRVSKHVGIRIFQVDYLRTNLPNNENSNQNSLRVGAGLVF
ncbi:outer membrane beta-barrel protein [Granulicella sp. S190]|uniref:outer membrane beta-barrel protein n=1 Tax=Granulicella sp. S190 TaxID=1747226 RepID=UPI0020B16EC4|nr:outer membrane beta-barrel protein [Granulicella sp. S190]